MYVYVLTSEFRQPVRFDTFETTTFIYLYSITNPFRLDWPRPPGLTNIRICLDYAHVLNYIIAM